MIKKKLTLLLTIVSVFTAIVLSGCAGESETVVVKNNTNQPTTFSNVNSINQTVDSPNNSAEVGNNIAALPTNNTAAAPPPTENNSAPPVKSSTPIISSGANDLTMIIKARQAMSSEKYLLDTVVVNSKDGNVTLTGKVPTAADKAKAEQLVRGVEGVKSLKNDITVAQ